VRESILSGEFHWDRFAVQRHHFRKHVNATRKNTPMPGNAVEKSRLEERQY
jgi:hypothetical protein